MGVRLHRLAADAARLLLQNPGNTGVFSRPPSAHHNPPFAHHNPPSAHHNPPSSAALHSRTFFDNLPKYFWNTVDASTI